MTTASESSAYVLVTGATGLLGRYLVRDLTTAGRRVAVLVRGDRLRTAAQRIDAVLDDWQRVGGMHVACPVVLEGDITVPGLGLAPDVAAWVAHHVDEVVHAAASLSFAARDRDGEPWLSNVSGTANVLAACTAAGIRRLHHVSTAYVCGQRQGRVLETEADVGQAVGNDYERSKLEAERLVRTAEGFEAVTIHRPSIIVGDTATGFTNTFQGFYAPLRIVQPFAAAFVSAGLPGGSMLAALGMSGAERKNLVPVDWVAAAITRIIVDRSLHGRTYHLTAADPTPAALLCRVFERLVPEMAATQPRVGDPAAAAGLARLFTDQMDVYRAYWRDDPEFDATATRQALPDRPPPILDEETIERLARFAIGVKCRWPPPGRVPPSDDPRAELESQLGQAGWGIAGGPHAIGIAAVGAGGGQWTIGRVGSGPAGRHLLLHGLPAANAPVIWLKAKDLATVLRGRDSIGRLLSSGRIAVEGGSQDSRQQALATLRDLAHLRQPENPAESV